MEEKSPFKEAQGCHCVKLIKWRLDCTGDPTMLEMPELWDILPRGAAEGRAPAQEGGKGVNVVQSAKLEGWSHLRPLTSDKELHDLESALLAFSLMYAHVGPVFLHSVPIPLLEW